MTPEIAFRLRAATKEAHSRLERRLDIFSHLKAPTTRAGLVARFEAMHASADRSLAPWLGDMPGLDYAGRRRDAHFRRDLATLPNVAAAPPPAPPSLRDAPEALGLFYVLESSTLGGHVIRKRLAGSGVGAEGLSFLDPYETQSGERWGAFIKVLDRESAAPGASEAMVAGAIAGFAWVAAALCGDEATA
ncbi:MAG: biliverdin-producing heme oxygenase [Caulobacteraceae bacterium]|nr:biliverdin-producing heme oxygenase [Caulobacteraceae bacterium]